MLSSSVWSALFFSWKGAGKSSLFRDLTIIYQLQVDLLGSSPSEMQDENRYSASRGTHINLKRAERARITVTKIPGNCCVKPSSMGNKYFWPWLLTLLQLWWTTWWARLSPGRTKETCLSCMMGCVQFLWSSFYMYFNGIYLIPFSW